MLRGDLELRRSTLRPAVPILLATSRMQWLDGLPLWGNVCVFTLAAIVVWRAGVRLTRGADAISHRTGLGQAFTGALLLGGATSLPEIAATVSASAMRNAPIAVNNIFGGIAMQVTILALADAAGRGALTARNRDSAVLLQGTLCIFVLTLAAGGIAVGEVAVAGVGLWTTAVFACVVAGLFLIKRYETHPQWQPIAEEKASIAGDGAVDQVPTAAREMPMRKLVMQLGIAALAVLAAGFAVARTGERIAEQTGIGASFVGAILIAIATSLPEVSTTLESVKLGARVMAISNIFGTNLFDAGLLFIADAFYPGPPVLNEVGRFALVAALLGIACTTIYLAGMLERRDRSVMRLGPDSMAVLVVYGGGVVLLYTLR